jgi:transcriptional regulator with XRE-family HTH domain
MKPVDPSVLILDQGGIGGRLADARKLAGLTQDGLALLVPCSKSLISQVERGKKSATPWLVSAAARALHVDVTELTGQPYRGTTEYTDRAHASIQEIRVAMNYLDVPPDLEVAPRSIGAIRHDVQIISKLLDKIDYVELGKRLPGLIEELSALLAHVDERQRYEVAELLMHAFIAAKSIAYRLGYVDLVSVAVDRATRLANETQRPELVAFAAEERCQVFFASAAFATGLRFIDRAHQTFDDLIGGSEEGLAISGSMHLRSAIMAARLESRSHDVWDHLGQAREYAERIGADTNHYGLAFGPTNVKIHEIAAAIEMEDADEALRRSEGFSPPPTMTKERSSHHYIDLARIQLMAGYRRRSLNSVVKADRLSPQHTQYHPMARETVIGLLRSHNRVPEALRSIARRMRVGSAT